MDDYKSIGASKHCSCSSLLSVRIGNGAPTYNFFCAQIPEHYFPFHLQSVLLLSTLWNEWKKPEKLNLKISNSCAFFGISSPSIFATKIAGIKRSMEKEYCFNFTKVLDTYGPCILTAVRVPSSSPTYFFQILCFEPLN